MHNNHYTQQQQLYTHFSCTTTIPHNNNTTQQQYHTTIIPENTTHSQVGVLDQVEERLHKVMKDTGVKAQVITSGTGDWYVWCVVMWCALLFRALVCIGVHWCGVPYHRTS